MSGENQLQGKSEVSADGPSSGGTVLYRFGHEMSLSSSSGSGRGLKSFGGGLMQSSSSMPSLELYDQQRQTSPDDETVQSYIPSAGIAGTLSSGGSQKQLLQQHGNRSMKLVSGSQFRLTSHAKGMIPPHCEQCDTLEKLNKKNKEIIRTLKLQLARAEESYRDLKYSKSSSSNNDQPEAMKEHGDGSVSGGGGNQKESNLRRKCEYLEDELNKFKKMLTYERSISDQLKQTLEDERGQYKTLNENLQQENEKLKQYIIHLETTNNHYQVTNDDLQAKLLAYKQQLEKTEQKLNESLE